MSSAILYIAIVAIWAFVLIPRWLRRPHLLGGEHDKPENIEQADAEVAAAEEAGPYEESATRPQPAGHSGPAPRSSRTKVLRARRRLLTTLLALSVIAAVCTYLRLSSWWVCVPPAGMLGIYLLLLRAAALADAEQARWRAAGDQRVRAARHRVPPEPEEQSAQIIDISARLNDQLYDQYADATIRAVGD